MPYFDEPIGRVKIQTTSKNSQRCYRSKRLIRGLFSDFFSLNSNLPSFFNLYAAGRNGTSTNIKQLLDSVFVISRIIKVEVRVISRSRRLRLITLTETLIILDITKTESNNCFIIH